MKELELESYEDVWTRMQNLESEEEDEIVFWKVGESEAVFAKRIDGQFEIFEMEKDLDDVHLRFNEEDLDHIKSLEESSSDDWDALEEAVKEVYSRDGTIVVQKSSDLKQVDVVVKAKVLRRELALRFPDQDFSVKTDRYTGGSSIDVSWEDGVAEAEVKPVVDMYQYTYPDEDKQSGYHHNDNHAFVKRSISEEAKEKVASEILDKFADSAFEEDHWRDQDFKTRYIRKVKKTSFIDQDDTVEIEA
jgi:hypothetical protein